MITSFYMPTRIVAGQGSLATIGTLARDLKMARALVVSDPVISQQPFYAAALDALAEAGIAVARFDGCGIDARCSHIDEQGERVRRDGIDGVVCVGGGSVIALVGLHRFLALITSRTSILGSLLKGEPRLLIKDGQVQEEEELQKAKLFQNDLAQALRIHAKQTDPSKIRRAYLERNGSISVIPYSEKPPDS